MESETNYWIDILREAWFDLIDDYRKLGERSGYAHRREEDIRCFLFCKIMNLLRENDRWLIDLAADVPILNQESDIGLVPTENDGWKIAVEIKRTGDLATIKEDLEKLRNFIANKRTEAGVFVTIAEYRQSLREEFKENVGIEFKLEEKDRGDNNFYEWHQIRIDRLNMNWDALFLALRSP